MVQDANKLVVFGSQLVGVLIVVVGLWTQQSKLQSPRPSGGKTPAIASADRKGDRFARLWDDPFPDVSEAAVLKPPTGGPSPTTIAQPSPPPVLPSPIPSNSPGPVSIAAKSPPPVAVSPERVQPCRQVRASKVKKSPPAVTLPSPVEFSSPSPLPTAAIPTPVPPSPSPIKKLIIWNILDAGQVPEIKERRLRIRYATVSAVLTAGYLPTRESSLSPLIYKASETAGEQEGKDLIGFFETFRSIPTCTAPFQRVILAWMPKEMPLDKTIIQNVKQQIAKRDGGSEEADVRVLHHGSSQDLEDYAASSLKPDLPGGISFMRATMAGPELDKYRPIISDDRLIGALFDELSLRIPALNTVLTKEKDRPRIVVIIERDTKYSHAIKKEIEKKFQDLAKLEFCSYLRGLDGRSENVPSAPDSAKSDNQETVSSNPKAEGFGETSLGTSQFDYLRRLAVRLGSETNSRKGHGVSAVGILGSDIYDKMLVLQATQPELPSAIFFTTDLDALYLEHGNQRFTRNLVVAGADGLNVNKSLPPMRDGYQTILARKVLDLLASQDLKSATVATPSPHVFEIAPGKSIDLKAGSPASSHTKARDFVLRQLSRPWMNIIVFCLGLANAFVILTAIFTRKAKQDPEREIVSAPMRPWARTFVYTEVILGFLGIVCLLIFLGWRKDTLLLGEPLALGVSIWPSVMIRLLAFLVAILLLLIASYAFVAQGKGLKAKLQNALPKNELRLPQGLARESARLCVSLAGELPVPFPMQSFGFHLDRFFGMEDQPLRRNYRLWRIIALSVFYFGISAFLFSEWPPTVPGRGAFALLNERLVLALGVSLYIIHLIFCLDLHIGAFNFLRALRALYAPESWKEIQEEGTRIDAKQMLEATSAFTSIIGKTLLYPLTVLILIILSRLRQFDNWVMTPSLTITFSLGAIALVTASLVLWLEGSRLKKQVLARHAATEDSGLNEFLEEDSRATQAGSAMHDATSQAASGAEDASVREKRNSEARAALAKEREELQAINEGVFAAWYNQPIFAAIFSAAAVFGSLSVAGPIARLFFE
jgi:hypothetical protein